MTKPVKKRDHVCAYCQRDLSRRGTRRTDHEGRIVCRRPCSWRPLVVTTPSHHLAKED